MTIRCKRCFMPKTETKRVYDRAIDDLYTEDKAHFCYGGVRIITQGIIDKHKSQSLLTSKVFIERKARRDNSDKPYHPSNMTPLEIALRWGLHRRRKYGVCADHV